MTYGQQCLSHGEHGETLVWLTCPFHDGRVPLGRERSNGTRAGGCDHAQGRMRNNGVLCASAQSRYVLSEFLEFMPILYYFEDDGDAM